MLEKARTLAFNYSISSSYKINNKIKASNFIIQPSWILLQKSIPISVEEKLFTIASATSKKLDHILLNEKSSYKQTGAMFNKENVYIEDIAKVYFYQLQNELKQMEKDKDLVKLFSVQVQRGFVDKATYFFDNKCIISTAGSFSAVHRHYNSDLSDEQNKQLYKKCSVDHGHEYEIRIFLKKTLAKNNDNKFFELSLLKSILEKKILKHFHGKYLNDLVGNTSGEILAKHCYNQIKPALGNTDLAVELNETRKNSFFYPVDFYNCSNF